MAKVITCRDVGMDCDFVARGETVEDVLQACAKHGKEAHGMDEIPPELAEKVKAAIRDEYSILAFLSFFYLSGRTSKERPVHSMTSP